MSSHGSGVGAPARTVGNKADGAQDRTHHGSTKVIQATVPDIPRWASTLARAFADDPVTRWLLPRSRRHSRMIAFFNLVLRSQIDMGQIYTTCDGVGASVWTAPGRWRFDDHAVHLPFERFRSIVGANLERALASYATLKAAHPTDRPHWYRATLGTHPDWQAEGVGGALMQTSANARGRRITAHLP